MRGEEEASVRGGCLGEGVEEGGAGAGAEGVEGARLLLWVVFCAFGRGGM